MAINLNQLNNGKWKACGPALQNHSVIIEHETPEEALLAAEAFLEGYELFLDHLYGVCNRDSCETCQIDGELSRRTHGMQSGKRPKRYDQ